ncbi:MAG: 1-deoxy-D-xylulose-5-phosphate reductoisomerase, partial [Bacillota bacterium]|nr:1-deoxy-D-xylulose-5-phosphate reductoisomerase [Bacillota bacterium]
MKRIAILGSTGSIGTQTLDVINWHPDLFKVELISANKNITLLSEQIDSYKPQYAVVIDQAEGEKLVKQYSGHYTKILVGMDGLMEAIDRCDFHTIVTAFSGAVGLKPTIAAINKGADIALANKETLVAAGKLVMGLARAKGVKIIPVDSEHSAIFQCLQGEEMSEVEKLILTASGGPFRGYKKNELRNITPNQALKHPKWNMGAKISIDSATLMNKGLEVIEACWLFGLDADKVEVVVHPQSIVHSLVEYKDGSILAHLGVTDMRIPIQYALSYPRRLETKLANLN